MFLKTQEIEYAKSSGISFQACFLSVFSQYIDSPPFKYFLVGLHAISNNYPWY